MTPVETPTTKTRKTWTVDDDQILRDNASKGAAEVANLLNRPVPHIRARATRLGVSVRRDGEKRGRRVKAN